MNENNYADNTIRKKSNYDIYMDYYKNEKNVDLTNNKELRNIILFGNYNEKIEEKQTYRLFQKSKNLILKKFQKTKSWTINTNKKTDDSEFKLSITPLSNSNKHLNTKAFTNIRNSFLINFENHKSRNRNIFGKIKFKFNRSDKNIIINKMNQNSKIKFLLNSRRDTNIEQREEKNNETIKKIYFNNSYIKKNVSDKLIINNRKSKGNTIQYSDIKNKINFNLLMFLN